MGAGGSGVHPWIQALHWAAVSNGIAVDEVATTRRHGRCRRPASLVVTLLQVLQQVGQEHLPRRPHFRREVVAHLRAQNKQDGRPEVLEVFRAEPGVPESESRMKHSETPMVALSFSLQLIQPRDRRRGNRERERERERGGETDRQTDRDKDRQTETERDREMNPASDAKPDGFFQARTQAAVRMVDTRGTHLTWEAPSASIVGVKRESRWSRFATPSSSIRMNRAACSRKAGC